ncbi:hypothetical protein SAY86_031180 [Trapa natans]|uniref:J domain-containing protein n=1 Tax=Trapa natans TaxID=22666 RepID=A0AAN7LRE4_TRANT|nr:hypothetical protein SAY86_031180 [Trapa natans]
MECNKDEAIRAKEIAEKKFMAKDLAGAYKFALKAQSLYPVLEGVSQMLAVLKVYVSSENKIHGESDWYGVLGVSPMDDEETIRKQFRKLALMLHPDKNKSMGADGAFKTISEAWSVLSDKAKRGIYDQKRRAKIFHGVSAATAGPPAHSSANGFNNFKKPTYPPTTAKVHKMNLEHTSHSRTQKLKSGTFWTVCHRCNTQFEYLRIYASHNLLCSNCREPFFAEEIDPPSFSGNIQSNPWSFSQHQAGRENQGTNKETMHKGVNDVTSTSGCDSSTQRTFPWAPFKGAGGGASLAAQAATMVQQAYEKVKRVREEAQAASKRGEALRRKHANKKSSGDTSNTPSARSSDVFNKSTSNGNTISHAEAATNHRGVQTGVGGVGVVYSFDPKLGRPEISTVGGAKVKLHMFREVPPVELHRILMEKARTTIRQKLAELEDFSRRKEENKKNQDMAGEEPLAEGGSQNPRKRAHAQKEAIPGINVPDSDFHDFDMDRTERSFGEDEIWAAYDNNDGMPRYYAIIHNIISLNPFKVQISWLNSKTSLEFGLLNWVSSGFTKTCGEFRVGKHEVYSTLNSFSHKVNWTRGPQGIICIYPRKGDIWALYRNWSPDWSRKTPEDIIHKYDMVEVLEDYSEEQGGVTVIPLVKVAGFKTVFHRHLDPNEIKQIRREEMFRFSHHVPSHLLTGKEAQKAPKGCRELDPAATPLELIHAASFAQGMENQEAAK